MDSVVLDVSSVQPALISEVLFKLLVDVVFYVLPADAKTQMSKIHTFQSGTNTSRAGLTSRRSRRPHLSALFTASPNPGVSMMVSLSLTPFSSMPTVCLTMPTVRPIRSANTRGSCKDAREHARSTRFRFNSTQKLKNESHLRHWELFCLCKGP